jgi:putative acetyltransferase
MKIRFATPDDLNGITRLFYATVNKINRRDYTQEQVEAWAAAALDLDYWRAKLVELYFWVAEGEDELLGFASLTPEGYLDHIFVNDQRQGEGVASALLDEVEAQARQLKLPSITSDVSITAKPFFEKQGFTVQRENRKQLKGLEFVNFSMEKAV